MNTDQTNTNELVVKRYANTYQVCVDLRAYASTRAPDQKSRNKIRTVLIAHDGLAYARDLLYSLYGAFDELSNCSWGKAVDANTADSYAKHHARADFYRAIATWANACYDLVKEAPVTKDAEDDSDPYVRPSPKDTPMEAALASLQEMLLAADFGGRRVDSATALFKSVVLERPSGATVLDVLERFGDEASELACSGDYNAACFWDACVQISDDLRSDMAADQIKTATVTVPDVVWEVNGDSGRALYRTKMDAERAALELFPNEAPARRGMRLQSRSIKP